MALSKEEIDKLTIDDMKPVTVSFKKNEDDFILYKWILYHSNYSGFVKDSLREKMETEEHGIDKKEVRSLKSSPLPPKSSGLIDLDF